MIVSKIKRCLLVLFLFLGAASVVEAQIVLRALKPTSIPAATTPISPTRILGPVDQPAPCLGIRIK